MLRMIRWYAKVRGRRASVDKRHSRPFPLSRALTAVDGVPKTPSYIRTGMPILRLREMCTELHGTELWNRTTCLAPAMTVAIYFGELTFAIGVAIGLLAISTLTSSITAV